MKKIILFLSIVFMISSTAMAEKLDTMLFYEIAGETPEEFQTNHGLSAQKFYDAIFLLKKTFEKKLETDLEKFNKAELYWSSAIFVGLYPEGMWPFALFSGLYHGSETEVNFEDERHNWIEAGYNEQYFDFDKTAKAIKTAFSAYKNFLGLSVEETDEKIGKDLFVAEFSQRLFQEVKQ